MNNLLLHRSYLKSPLPIKLTWQEKQKNNLLLNKFKNTESAHICKLNRGTKSTYDQPAIALVSKKSLDPPQPHVEKTLIEKEITLASKFFYVEAPSGQPGHK